MIAWMLVFPLLLVCCNYLKIIVFAVKYIINACFFHRYTLALLRFLLFNCNLSNYMLLLFFLWDFFGFTMYASCLATCNVWGYLVVIVSNLCTFVKLSWKSLWIKASAKCINVNKMRVDVTSTVCWRCSAVMGYVNGNTSNMLTHITHLACAK